MSVTVQGQRSRRKKERGERKWDRQTSSSLPSLLPSFVSLLPPRGSEGGHPHLQALNQPAGDLALPGYSAHSLGLPPMLPSCCHLSAAGARLHCHEHRGAGPADAQFSACVVPKLQ